MHARNGALEPLGASGVQRKETLERKVSETRRARTFGKKVRVVCVCPSREDFLFIADEEEEEEEEKASPFPDLRALVSLAQATELAHLLAAQSRSASQRAGMTRIPS